MGNFPLVKNGGVAKWEMTGRTKEFGLKSNLSKIDAVVENEELAH